MSSGPRSFGAADRRLLPEGRLAGPMPWVIAIMMFLTVLAAAAGLGLGGAAVRLNAQLGSRITVQEPNRPGRRQFGGGEPVWIGWNVAESLLLPGAAATGMTSAP